jgi:NAD(P) transhydrogenase subunit alpha
MSGLAGYRAIVLAAAALPRCFPLFMTAAGVVTPAKVFVLGAGVAGLQAIATAKRLGAVVEAFDTRPAVREQVESLGARFVALALEGKPAETAGGYAGQLSSQTQALERELVARHVAAADVVVTTALVPGKRAPVLIGSEPVLAMRAGSVIVDLAAEAGGNCAYTVPGETIVEHGVTIVGTLSLANDMPGQASQLYARNVRNLLRHLINKGTLQVDLTDEITAGTCITREGEVPQATVRGLLPVASLQTAEKNA